MTRVGEKLGRRLQEVPNPDTNTERSCESDSGELSSAGLAERVVRVHRGKIYGAKRVFTPNGSKAAPALVDKIHHGDVRRRAPHSSWSGPDQETAWVPKRL